MKHPRHTSARQRRRVLARRGHGCYWRPVGFYSNRPALFDKVFTGSMGWVSVFRFVASYSL